DYSGTLDLVDELVERRQLQCDRLLTEGGQRCPCSESQQRHVPWRRGRDHEPVDVQVEQRLGRLGRIDAELRRDRASTLRVRIGERQTDDVLGLAKRLRVKGADSTDPDETK